MVMLCCFSKLATRTAFQWQKNKQGNAVTPLFLRNRSLWVRIDFNTPRCFWGVKWFSFRNRMDFTPQCSGLGHKVNFYRIVYTSKHKLCYLCTEGRTDARMNGMDVRVLSTDRTDWLQPPAHAYTYTTTRTTHLKIFFSWFVKRVD